MDQIDEMFAARFGQRSQAPVPPGQPATQAAANPQGLPPGLPLPTWDDTTLLALSRDTRAWITQNPDGGPIGDWYDARPHTTLLYYLAKWINWSDPRLAGPTTPPLIIEIGVRHGVTSLALLHACRETGGSLTSIEIDASWAAAAKREVDRAGLSDWWDLHVMSSDDFALPAGQMIDLLWVDGDHGEAQVRKDVARYAPLVRRNGIMALHDYYSLPWVCDPPVCPPFPSFVSPIVEELRRTGEWEVFVVPFSFGVALCRKL